MVQVQPGNVTGIFYIIVAGLPWNTSWQKLKDLSRNQQPDGKCIEVDHVYVYPPDGTNGWVRVKGSKNFLKAMDHLKTAVLDHKCIMVDGRNETDITNLADVIPATGFESLPRRTRNDSSSPCDAYPSSTASYYGDRNNSSVSVYSGSDGWYGQNQPGMATSPMSSASPKVSHYQQSPQAYDHYNAVSLYSSSDYFQPPSPAGVVYAGSIAPMTPIFVTPIPQPPLYKYTATAVSYMEAVPLPPAPEPVIRTEARKIIITQLPHSVSHQELEQLLFKYIARAPPMPSPSTEGPYLELTIATHSDKKPRGHAFAVLGSEPIARYVIKSVDGLRFHNRMLKVKLAKEGVEFSTSSQHAQKPQLISPMPDYQYQIPAVSDAGSSNRDSRDTIRPFKKTHAKTAISSPAHEDSKSKMESRDKSRDRERRESSKKKNASPMVVNGSSGEHQEKSKKYRSW